MGDFLAFRKMITPLVIQIIFWIGVIASVIGGVVIISQGSRFNSTEVTLLGLAYIFLGPLIVRIYCELLILFFRMLDELVAIRHALGGSGQSHGFPVMPVAPSVPGQMPSPR